MRDQSALRCGGGTVQGTPIWPTRLTISFERSIRPGGDHVAGARASAEASTELALLPGSSIRPRWPSALTGVFSSPTHPTAPSEKISLRVQRSRLWRVPGKSRAAWTELASAPDSITLLPWPSTEVAMFMSQIPNNHTIRKIDTSGTVTTLREVRAPKVISMRLARRPGLIPHRPVGRSRGRYL